MRNNCEKVLFPRRPAEERNTEINIAQDASAKFDNEIADVQTRDGQAFLKIFVNGVSVESGHTN